MKLRGESEEMVTNVQQVDISCLAWLDNMQVMLTLFLLASSYGIVKQKFLFQFKEGIIKKISMSVATMSR